MIKLSLLVADSASASGAASEDTSAESSAVEKRANSRRNCYGHCLLNLRDGKRRRTDERSPLSREGPFLYDVCEGLVSKVDIQGDRSQW